MPELVQLCKEYSEKGIIFICVPLGVASKESAFSFCDAMNLKINFIIMATCGIDGVNIKGAHAVIFDHNGKIVFSDHPFNGIQQKLKECADTAPDWLTGPYPFAKLKSLANDIKNRRNLGRNLKTLREKINSSDPAEKEEAEQLFSRLCRHAQQKFDAAKALQGTEPANYVKQLEEVAKTFKEDEIGIEAQKLLDELKKDPAFQNELDAEKDYLKLEKSVKEEFKSCGDCAAYTASCQNCKNKNEKTQKKLKSDIDKFLEKHPDTICARKTDELKKKYGVE